MNDFLFRLPFAIFGAYIGSKRGDYLTMFVCSLIGASIGEFLFSIL